MYEYEYGEDIPPNYVKAIRWYRLAADQGHAGAQNRLGFSYSQGEGIPQDVAQAIRWFRRAANQNDAGAQFSLGSMYMNGEGVLQDYVEAHMWLNLAAAQPSELLREVRDAVEERMTSEQIAEAQRRAREWKPIDQR